MKRNIGIGIVVVLICGLSAMAVLAQGPGKGRGHGAPPLITALDADGDGVIGIEEMANANEALLSLDENSDGQLSQEEFRPPWAGGKGRRGGSDQKVGGPGSDKCDGSGRKPPKSPIIEALDANDDRILDAAEIATASTVLMSLDADADGILSGDEYRPQRPGGQGKGRGRSSETK